MVRRLLDHALVDRSRLPGLAGTVVQHGFYKARLRSGKVTPSSASSSADGGNRGFKRRAAARSQSRARSLTHFVGPYR